MVDYGLLDYLLRSDETTCENCGKHWGEGDIICITMIPHKEGTVESGPSPPEMVVLCKECERHCDENEAQMRGGQGKGDVHA